MEAYKTHGHLGEGTDSIESSSSSSSSDKKVDKDVKDKEEDEFIDENELEVNEDGIVRDILTLRDLAGDETPDKK